MSILCADYWYDGMGWQEWGQVLLTKRLKQGNEKYFVDTIIQ
jgi:hypothetical protein